MYPDDDSLKVHQCSRKGAVIKAIHSIIIELFHFILFLIKMPRYLAMYSRPQPFRQVVVVVVGVTDPEGLVTMLLGYIPALRM